MARMILIFCRPSSIIPYNQGMLQGRAQCLRFGKQVREERGKLGISQEELADLAGVHRTYIGGIERGERNPTLITIYKIAAALGIQPSRLLGEAPPSTQ